MISNERMPRWRCSTYQPSFREALGGSFQILFQALFGKVSNP